MKIEVSSGEIADKISILIIKKERIKDKSKLSNIQKELDHLLPCMDEIGIGLEDEFFLKLKSINEKLWDIEDSIRDLESKKQFDHIFIDTARQVYRINDKRCRVKNQINEETGSWLREEKSYKDFK